MRDVELPSSDGGGGGGAAKLLAKSVALMVLRWDNVFVELASESDDLQNLDIYWFLNAVLTAFNLPDPITPPLDVVFPMIKQ